MGIMLWCGGTGTSLCLVALWHAGHRQLYLLMLIIWVSSLHSPIRCQSRSAEWAFVCRVVACARHDQVEYLDSSISYLSTILTDSM
ncbi:hypothetical protein C8Q74DRAFT_1277690 [Fomes fomentarius]|nr:hypothetical protein C8Q74DRAFT_1277690 [Fomes fomentarius]